MEINYNEVFGVGAKAQELADPEPENNGAGAEVPEVAEPTVDDKGQDDNARFAAARRKAEAEKAAEIAKKNKEMDTLIAGLGLTDANGAAITTKAQYDAYKKSRDDATKAENARKLGTTPEELDKIVEASPQMKAAKEREAQFAKAETERRLNTELAEISKLDPTVKGFDDLAAQENFGDVLEKVQRGYSLVDAYKLANMEKLASSKAAAAKQKAMNSAASKAHMQPLGTNAGKAPIPVPEKTLEYYHRFCPGMSDEDIAKHYNKTKGK